MGIQVPQRLDISRQILIREQGHLKLNMASQAMNSGVELTDNIGDEFMKLFSDGVSEVAVTNRGIGGPDQGLFILKVDSKKIALKERRSVQQLSTEFLFETQKLLFNDGPAGSGFLTQFLMKLDHINTLVKQGKAKVGAKRSAS